MPDTDVADRPAPGEAAAGGPLTDVAGFRLAVFAAVLVVALATGFGLGRLTGPSTPTPAPAATADPHAGHGTAAHVDPPGTAPHQHNPDGSNATAPLAGSAVGGLATSTGTLTLVPQNTTFEPGKPQPLRFTIVGAGRVPITTFAVVHDKPLHLIVARRDLTGYQHLHPVMAPDGTWSVDLTLPTAGSWRMFADFTATVGGTQTAATLGADLTVPGAYDPVPLAAPAQQTTVAGLTVAYEGAPRVEATQPLLFRVTRAGAPVTPEPYLGAYGHLVVLREGDLGYVHVHPEPQLADGAVKFWTAAPSAGRYRMFFDVQVDGVVHTAAYSVTVS